MISPQERSTAPVSNDLSNGQIIKPLSVKASKINVRYNRRPFSSHYMTSRAKGPQQVSHINIQDSGIELEVP